MEGKELVAQNESGDRFMDVINNLEKIEQFCLKMAKSSIIPSRLKGKPEDIAVTLLYGKEIGLTPMQALTEIYVVNGIPSIGGKTMLSRIYNLAPGAHIQWIKQSETEAVLEMARDSSKRGLYTSRWTIDMATSRGLMKKDNWRNNPTMMLRWRCISECARVVFPDIISGYIPDEIDSMETDAHEMERQAETHQRVKESAIEIKNKFAEPEEVISFTEAEEMKDDPFAHIKSQIKNRDWKINVGKDKGRCLHEFSIEALEERLVGISKHWSEITEKSPKAKMPDDTKALFDNVTAYCDSYRQIENQIIEEENLKDQEQKEEK